MLSGRLQLLTLSSFHVKGIIGKIFKAAQIKLDQIRMSASKFAISQSYHGQCLRVTLLTRSICKWVHLTVMCTMTTELHSFHFFFFRDKRRGNIALFSFAQICSRS